MKTSFKFYPVHIENTVARLRERFGKASDLDRLTPIYFKDYEAMLRRVSAYSDSEAQIAAYELTSREMQALASYVGINSFHLNTHPMCIILKQRENITLFQRIYTSWKCAYNEKDIIDVINAYYENESMHSLFEQNKLSREQWHEWTNGFEQIEVQIARWLIQNSEPIEKLKDYQISIADPIFQAVKNARLLCCDKKEYAECTNEYLIKIMSMFSQNQQHLFLQNFLTVGFSRSELFGYRELNQWFCNQYSFAYDPSGRSQFWKGATQLEIQEFHKWRLICNITLVFNNDERSRYWMGYLDQIEDAYTVKVPSGDIGYRIAMIFKSFVVVDFSMLGYAARIVDRDFYRNRLARYFEVPVQIRNNDLRQLMPINQLIDRVQHYDGWQHKTDVLINSLIRRSGQ